jgi:ligand-binding sensor domain-containing protein
MFVCTTAHGLAHDNTWTIFQRRDGHVWIGTEHGLSKFIAWHFTNYSMEHGLYENHVRALAEDASGKLWIGMRRGLNWFAEGKFHLYPMPEGAAPSKVRTLLAARDGALWIGTAQGLFCIRDGQRIGYAVDDGLSNDDVRALLEDKAGNLWIGTAGGGLNCARPEGIRPNRLAGGTPAPRFTAYTTTNGLSSNHAFALHEDADGVLWIGTENGLNRMQAGRFTHFTAGQGLFDQAVHHILEDDFGHLWLSTDDGIYRVPRQQLNDVAAGRGQTVRSVRYTEADGMPTRQTSGEVSQPAGCKTTDGRLWFPTPQGVVVFDPRNPPDIQVPPPVVIEQVIADHEIVFGDGASDEFKVQGSRFKVQGSRREGNPTQPAVAAAHAPGLPSAIHLPPGRARVVEFRYTPTPSLPRKRPASNTAWMATTKPGRTPTPVAWLITRTCAPAPTSSASSPPTTTTSGTRLGQPSPSP